VQQGSETLNIEQALSILRRRVPLIALCLVIVAGVAYGYSKHQKKKYTSVASLAFSNNALSQQVAGLPVTSSGNLLAQEASNVELVKLGDMAEKTAQILGHGLTPERVISSVSVAGQGESAIVAVSATTTSPVLAAAIANTYTEQFVKEQKVANRKYFQSALALVRKQLKALTPKQQIGQDGLELQQRAQSLSLLSELNYGNVQVAQAASVPGGPSSPKTSRNTLLGGLLGLLIGLGLAFVLERLDRRITGPEDLEAIYRFPILGVVPDSASLARREGVGDPPEAEAFNLIRAHLRFFNVDHDLHTVVIASASPGDGKTTVARHLAAAAARMGSRVLLLEADLRQPTLAAQLEIKATPGLTDVLIGAVSLEDAVQSVALAAPRGERAANRGLDVLTAGSVAPNPGEMIESRAMLTLLEGTKAVYDLVVIDTPPLTAVSDGFPLLTKVDGVVLVGWVGRSSRDPAERLHQILDSSGAPVLGVIANGAKSGAPGSYPSTARPAAPSDNGSSPAEALEASVKA
jgi:succinoglycan biosynthesis transport protein ExoP